MQVLSEPLNNLITLYTIRLSESSPPGHAHHMPHARPFLHLELPGGQWSPQLCIRGEMDSEG